MFDSQVFFPVVSQRLVEFAIFLLRNIVWITGPDRFCLVQLFIFGIFFLNGFLFLFVLVGLILILIFANIFNFGFVSILSLLFVLIHFVFFSLIIRNFLVAFFFDQHFDGIANELGMFFDNFFDSFFFMVISLVFLQMQNYLGTSSQRFRIIWLDCERTSS